MGRCWSCGRLGTCRVVVIESTEHHSSRNERNDQRKQGSPGVVRRTPRIHDVEVLISPADGHASVKRANQVQEYNHTERNAQQPQQDIATHGHLHFLAPRFPNAPSPPSFPRPVRMLPPTCVAGGIRRRTCGRMWDSRQSNAANHESVRALTALTDHETAHRVLGNDE